MSLFANFGNAVSQPHSRSASGSSLDDLDVSTGSFGSSANAFAPGASTERFERHMQHLQQHGYHLEDDEEWDIISKKIDSCVRLDTQFFEYPTDQNPSPPSSSNPADDDELTGTKVFLGGMRFEVVQLGRHMVSWLLEMASGVKLPVGRILIHRKSRNGKPAAPTGCASVYVADDEDVAKLIDMNQKIFCGERGLHVASTPERMAELIHSKTILHIAEGRVRGPTHPMIIEKAYSSTTTHSPVSIATTPLVGPPASPSSSLSGSFSGKPAPPITITDGSAPPVYHKYDGGETKPATSIESAALQQPLELFVGGLCYEATRAFVSWLFSLMGIRLHPQNVTLYIDPATGVKRGCAQVKIEEADFARASTFTRRMLCDACGVYIADTPQGIVAVQQTKERSDHGTRGPTHAVVIERRRNTQRTQQQQQHNNMPHSQHHMPHHHGVGGGQHGFMGPAPPPPPPGQQMPAPPPPPGPMQFMQGPGGQPFIVVPNVHANYLAQGGFLPPGGWVPPAGAQVQPGGAPGFPVALAPMAAPPGGMPSMFGPGGLPSYRPPAQSGR